MRLGLVAGDWVIVRPPNEILATLDAGCRLDGLPFQPEMFAYCGQRLRVRAVAHKTCDSSVHHSGGRRLHDTVHLEAAVCDGSDHDGCQAECSFFWKEAWLRRADREDAPKVVASGTTIDENDVARMTRRPDGDPADPTWVCQTTEIYDATDPLPWWDVRQYALDVVNGNHGVWHMIKLLSRAAYGKLLGFGVGYRVLLSIYDGWQRLRGGKPYPAFHGRVSKGDPTPAAKLDLAPGEWVEVKSAAEIGATVTSEGFNRGMRFDPEMLKYSGERFQVRRRVTRLVNEKNGKMSIVKTPCIQLENVFCRAEFTPMRLGCPRASSTYWREIWLKRCAPPSQESRS